MLHGAMDALKESAKQFRATGDQGHASICERHRAALGDDKQEILAVVESLVGVLDEPGIMDIDAWKAWRKEASETGRDLVSRLSSR